MFDFKSKKNYEITSFDIVAYFLAALITKKINRNNIEYLKFIVDTQIDKLGIHKSYNILEHSKYINNLNEIKNILLYFKRDESTIFDNVIIKMTSILNEYFHKEKFTTF